MRALIRADASTQMGTGHVMRCMTLANVLRDAGYDCHFICRDLPGYSAGALRDQGFEVHLLPATDTPQDDCKTAHSSWLTVTQEQDARETRLIADRLNPNWLIVDHYALAKDWEQVACPPDTRIMAIDDLADRPHDCDVLLDQNLGRQPGDYEGLVPVRCKCLTGPRYALLRPQFAAARESSLTRRARLGTVRTILISMGGMDANNATGQVLDELAQILLPDDAEVNIVMGGLAPHLDLVRAQAADMPFRTTVCINVADMAGLLTQTDLAIGAAGGSAWERCCLGVPALLLTLADNQQPAARALAKAGAVVYIGDLRDARWCEQFAKQAKHNFSYDHLRSVSQNAAALTDGKGTLRCYRTIQEITG